MSVRRHGVRQACGGNVRNAVPLRPRELNLPQLLAMLEEILTAKFRIERMAFDTLQVARPNRTHP
jgi:hypothetical protein